MPKLQNNAQDNDNTSLGSKVEQMLPTVSLTTTPVMIVGVNRRVGLGNYEHIDLYAGIALPMEGASIDDVEALKEMVVETSKLGFNLVSKETYDRYSLLVEAQKPKETT